MPQSDLYRRHDWVTLPEDWRRGLLSHLAPEDEEALARWAEKRRPLVVARQDRDAPGVLRLGLALPGKKRVGVAMIAEVVELLRRPPFFRDIVETGAAFWPEPMRELALLVGRVQQAAGFFTGAVGVDPENASAFAGLGATAFAARDLQAARRYYDRANGIDPNAAGVRSLAKKLR